MHCINFSTFCVEKLSKLPIHVLLLQYFIVLQHMKGVTHLLFLPRQGDPGMVGPVGHPGLPGRNGQDGIPVG